MIERFDTFLSEQYRREEERRYADAYRLAKDNGLPVSYYRKLICAILIGAGEWLVKTGKRLQSPMESAPRPLAARIE